MSAEGIRRRLFLGSAVGALALRPSTTAQADTAFTNFSFPATGAPTARTMPDRLGDVINVKDWGAIGNGRTNDIAAIQAAINHAASKNYGGGGGGGGTVFFPPGRYLVASPLQLSSYSSIRILGSGKYNTQILGNFPGWVLTNQGHIYGSQPPNTGYDVTAVTSGTRGVFRLTLKPPFGPTNSTFSAGALFTGFTVYVAGITGTGGITNANGTWVITVVDDTHIELNGSTFSGTYASGGKITGGTDRALLCVEHIGVQNASTALNSGALYIGYNEDQAVISDCDFVGFNAVNIAGNNATGGSFGIAIRDCHITCSQHTVGLADASNTGGAYAGMQPGSVGIYLSQGQAVNCRCVLFDVGYAISSVGTGVFNCSCERSNVGLTIGARDDQTGNTVVQGFQVIGLQTERCNVGVRIINGSGGLIAGNQLTGTAGTPGEASIQNMTWSQGVTTVTTTNPHHLGPTGTVVGIALQNINPSGFGAPSYAGILRATVQSPTTFSYTGVASNPGTYVPGGQWNRALTSAIQVYNCNHTVFAGNKTSNFVAAFSAVDLNAFGGGIQTQNVFMACDASSGFVLPSPPNRAGWSYLQIGRPTVNMRFADLPGQSGVYQTGPFEGQEYDIVDGQKSGGGSAGFGDTVAGGGTGHYKVRHDGTNWIRCG